MADQPHAHDRDHGHVHHHGHDAHNYHDHDHSLGHAHAPVDFGRAFAIGVGLNVAIVVVQVVYGIAANSMALLADAGHNLSDVFGLLLAWGASVLVKRAPTQRFTYGLGNSSILAALGNAIFLLVACGGIAWEAIQRFHTPEPVAGFTVMIVAALGIVINGLTAWLFVSGQKDDINIRGAFLHMVGDAAISFGVVVAGAMTLLTGWYWLDPAVSLGIVALIVWSTWGMLRQSIDMALHGVPRGIDVGKVRAFLLALPGVRALHDLHIWPTSTTETALTCHLVMPGGHPGDAFMLNTAATLKDQFRIGHSTLQIELSEDCACALASDEVV